MEWLGSKFVSYLIHGNYGIFFKPVCLFSVIEIDRISFNSFLNILEEICEASYELRLFSEIFFDRPRSSSNPAVDSFVKQYLGRTRNPSSFRNDGLRQPNMKVSAPVATVVNVLQTEIKTPNSVFPFTGIPTAGYLAIFTRSRQINKS